MGLWQKIKDACTPHPEKFDDSFDVSGLNVINPMAPVTEAARVEAEENDRRET